MWISTLGWLSLAVENTSDFFVGMVVLASINLVITLPMVSIPKDKGVTSSKSTSFTSPASTPPWIAAPMATTSSGFTPLLGSLPKNFFTASWMAGIRVEPPTKMTSSMSPVDRPAFFNADLQGAMVRSIKSATRRSKSARDMVFTMCLGPLAVAVI